MNFFDIRHLKSVNAVLVSRPKKFLRRNTRPFFTTESGKRYSANVSVVTGVAEIPKTVMITSRAKGPAYAATAGFMTGIVHMMGRTLFGTVDLVTFMIPTRPLVNPDYIWYNFNRETSYDLTWQLR